MDNSGGAKPKTMSSVNNNSSNTNSQQGTSSSTQTMGAQPRHRSERMENTSIPRSSGRTSRSLRIYPISSTNGYASRTTSEDPTSRRASVPSSTIRTRHSSSTQTRSNGPLIPTYSREYSPLRGTNRMESRGLHWYNGNPEYRRRSLRYLNPVPRIGESMHVGPLESPTGDVHPPLTPSSSRLHPSISPSLHGLFSSSEDSDSESGSSVSPPLSSQLRSPESMGPLTLPLPQANGDHQVGSSRDAVLARELLQSEMDMMMQRDEEMARQLQSEIDDDDVSDEPRPYSMFSLGMIPPTRSRRLPTIRRQEGGPGREGRGSSTLRFMHSSPERVDANPMLRHAMRFLGVGRPRGISSPGLGRAMQTDSSSVRRRRRRPFQSADAIVADPAYDEYDPDEQLLAGGLDPPDDFLSMMNDPSLMLLMLLLRAPDSVYQNEAGVDMEDYEALWDLAEQLGEVRRRGISEEEISLLPTQKYKFQGQETAESTADASAAQPGAVQCQICLVDFENGDCLRCIPCKHDFHKDCIDEWLKRNATCPICRQDIRPEPVNK
ncbi:uncharacterized protein LOC143289956 isoform X2 [Babylonia areolata]|uniref:uncharacterized protein LOC143289956 isoform X2 n=1 Tax=Babylonia areolata TaxID=304850 RepID=UPI003FD052ED